MDTADECGAPASGPKRPKRRWTAADKLRLVAETLEPGISIGRVARHYGIAHHLLRRWRRLVSRGMLGELGAHGRCALCDQPLVGASRSDARFCSSKCRQKAYRLHRFSLLECS
jgi:transposase-like protein